MNMLRKIRALPGRVFHTGGHVSLRAAARLGHAGAKALLAPAKGNGASLPAYLTLEEGRRGAVDTEALGALKDRHKGGRCFIVGNGPSLNKLDLTKLAHDASFAVNGIFYKTDEMGYTPTYYVVEDSHVVHDNLERIRTYPVAEKFFPSTYRSLLGGVAGAVFFQMNRGFYEKTGPNFRLPRFSTDAAVRLYCGQSVTYINLQLAWHMGFTEVYLIGMDFSYDIPESAVVEGLNILSTEDDPNHFHPEYFGKGKQWHDPQLEMVRRCYRHAGAVYEWSGRTIYNATPGGKLEVFPRVDYDSLF